MSDKLNAPWLFVIDTEDYAGNFERELCAFITGRVGECGVGDDCAVLFRQQVKDMGDEPFINIIEEADDHGCHRPCAIYPTPGWFNDGMGGQYQIGKEAEALIEYRKTAAAYYRDSIACTYWKEWQKDPAARARFIKAGWTEQALKKEVDESNAKAMEAEKTTKLAKYPSYQSVAISFQKKPTQAQIDLMKSRAEVFAKLPDKYNGKSPRISKIIGFRLVKNSVKRTAKSTSV